MLVYYWCELHCFTFGLDIQVKTIVCFINVQRVPTVTVLSWLLILFTTTNNKTSTSGTVISGIVYVITVVDKEVEEHFDFVKKIEKRCMNFIIDGPNVMPKNDAKVAKKY